MAPRSLKGWQNRVWKKFSEYIRRRDSDWRGYGSCISCQQNVHWKEADAGHWIHGKHYGTWLDERNVHLQCRRCNRASLNPQSENHARYAAALIKKYGPDVCEELSLQKTRNMGQRWTIKELKEVDKEIDEKLENI